MVQWFDLTMMFNGRTVFALDVLSKMSRSPNNGAFDVADVELYWEAAVVADEQDVFVAIDVYRLIGDCRKGKLGVVRLKRYVICKAPRCNQCNSSGVTEDSPATKKSSM